MKISEIILMVVELLQKEHPNFDIKILSKEMFRLPNKPTGFEPKPYKYLGPLGVYISVLGQKTFLGHELHAEDMLMFQHFRESYIFGIILPLYEKLKIQHEIKEN